MPSNIYPFIAREGWPWLALLAIAGLLAEWYLGRWPALVLVGIWLLLAFLLRDPPRAIPAAAFAVLSPVDGRIEEAEERLDPWLKREAQYARLRMSPFGVYSLRCPCEGKVMEIWCARAESDPGLRQCAFWIRTDEGDDIVVTLGLRWWPHRLRLYVQSGERIGQGQRCGYLFLGGQVEVYLPPAARREAQPGQQAHSGIFALAKLPPPKSAGLAAAAGG
jgi:phosphatidylserine decarboxylase